MLEVELPVMFITRSSQSIAYPLHQDEVRSRTRLHGAFDRQCCRLSHELGVSSERSRPLRARQLQNRQLAPGPHHLLPNQEHWDNEDACPHLGQRCMQH